jgi:hypothetical protein
MDFVPRLSMVMVARKRTEVNATVFRDCKELHHFVRKQSYFSGKTFPEWHVPHSEPGGRFGAPWVFPF